eukprot:4753269-Alexandrium_andersonii.AAC.1
MLRAGFAHHKAQEWTPGNAGLIAVPLRLRQRAPRASLNSPRTTWPTLLPPSVLSALQLAVMSSPRMASPSQ